MFAKTLVRCLVAVTALIGIAGCAENLTRPDADDILLAKGGKVKVEPMTVTNFQVVPIPDNQYGEAGDRCPDPDNPCNKLVFEYTGTLDSMRFLVAPDFEDKYKDPDIELSHIARGDMRSHATEMLTPVVPGRVEAYWQGQWRPTYWETPMGPSELMPEELIPNLDLLEVSDRNAPDHFIFWYGYFVGKEGRMGASLPDHYAVFKGPDRPDPDPDSENDWLAYARLEVREPYVIPPRNKNNPGTIQLQFAVQTFKTDVQNLQNRSTTLHALSSVILTYPNSSDSTLLRIRSHGITYDDPEDVHESVFWTDPVTESGCYEARIIGVDTYPGVAEYYNDRFYVWDRSEDHVGIAPLGVQVDLTYSEIVVDTYPGGCPVPQSGP